METYSPVVQIDSIRAILAITLVKKLKIHQMDIKGAYLNGILKETIYMKQPEGCEDSTNHICKLIKTLYGQKQSGQEWNKRLDEKLKKHGYKPLHLDPCVYTQWDGDQCAIITIWVDDLLLFASSDKMMNQEKGAIKSEWEVSDLGEPNKIIRIKIMSTPHQITISQMKYIEAMLEKEGMADANAIGTPLDLKDKFEPNLEYNEPNRSNKFANLLGKLQYVANSTRPDIQYAVNRLAAYTANPSLKHYSILK
jgi:Reverse transcriptase (RNA-dependent DNA polymerase)